MNHHCSLIEPLEARIAPAAMGAINLSSLDGKTGFKMSGQALGDEFGYSVHAAGDINGDGFADVIIGAPQVGAREGAAYVVFGKAGGFSKTLDLSTLDGTNGFKITPEAKSTITLAGTSVSAVGDINGDGFDDLAVGVPYADSSAMYTGAAYVIFGKASGFGASMSLADLNGSNGFKLTGHTVHETTGFSVSGAGDFNGDGFDDLIVGSRVGSTSFLVFGKAGGFAPSLDLSTLDGTNGFAFADETGSDLSGYSVSRAGDVNGDGFDDVIIGAIDASPHGQYSGAAYVVFGKASGFTPSFALSSLNGTNGFKLQGEAAKDYAGISVSGAGDINGDGFADVIVGAHRQAPNNVHDAGASYVVFGRGTGFGTPLDLSALNGVDGFKIEGEAVSGQMGRSVSAAGDVNGDGIDDLIVGAYDVNNNTGTSYVVYGKRGTFSTPLNGSAINGSNGFKLLGEAADDYAGRAVSGAGDVNGDGIDDLIIGANGADNSTGAAYVVFGKAKVSLSKDHKTATFPDSDGDIVSVKVSKGALTGSNFSFAGDGSLAALDLTKPGFAGADVTLSAKKAKNGTGDGVVDVDKIDAHGIDLGKVSVSGRLEQLFAGDASVLTAGVKSLTVGTLGQQVFILGAAVDYHSKIIGAVGALTVKGSVHAEDFEVTGGALAGIGKIKITGSLDPGLLILGKAGFIHASGDIGAVSVGASVIGGADFSGIAAGGKLGKVTIGGALTSPDATKPVILSALGKLGATTTEDAVAIAGVSVKTNVLNARILAGYNTNLTPLNPDAGIGAISVMGKWEASSVAAGVQDTSTMGDLTSAPDGFGQHDTLIAEPVSNTIFSTIASIVIKGTATGRDLPTTDFFGITAQVVGKLSINGAPVPLPAGNTPIDLDATNHNFQLVRF